MKGWREHQEEGHKRRGFKGKGEVGMPTRNQDGGGNGGNVQSYSKQL